MLPVSVSSSRATSEPVAQVRQVGVDAELPGVAEGLDLLGLTGDVLDLAVLHVALAGRDLPVGAELDAVRRVDVDHLDLAPSSSFSARLVITSSESPRIMRFDQLLSCS